MKILNGYAIVLLANLILVTGCSKSAPSDSDTFSSDPNATPTGSIRIDGSSTVFPISMAVAEEFGEAFPKIKVPVKQSGTGGGMKQFTVGEVDICDASRKIKDSELEACKENGVEFVELTVAFDGMAVVAHPDNDWCDCITVEQLKNIWRPESDGQITKWSDVNPDWPEEELKLYGPGTDSGTFEYFTEAIVGEARASRPDYTASENDNALVRGVAADKGALGYFGYAYFAENKDQLKLLSVNNGTDCVAPSEKTVRDGTYAPLSRPLYIYVSKDSLTRPEVAQFVNFYLDNVDQLSGEVGYVPVTKEVAEENAKLLQAALNRS
ncbi:PstS family phosphate ABC transporter substrate-binding protein [Bythopirellula polymerisocia]|uniref:Phosphate-binding protein n=1 Tax=Bythopirellula polymerisocia TaxID=2528003 RepID=A0A5C6CHD5_9BACT|nr:PstS family phosphate ABC transporter substrate-binding protein [Bythopirellula polymerisocia]TWU23602.1 Phosphate-binding protein PstS precursor [Bythopirellula polymerisocia]